MDMFSEWQRDNGLAVTVTNEHGDEEVPAWQVRAQQEAPMWKAINAGEFDLHTFCGGECDREGYVCAECVGGNLDRFQR